MVWFGMMGLGRSSISWGAKQNTITSINFTIQYYRIPKYFNISLYALCRMYLSPTVLFSFYISTSSKIAIPKIFSTANCKIVFQVYHHYSYSTNRLSLADSIQIHHQASTTSSLALKSTLSHNTFNRNGHVRKKPAKSKIYDHSDGLLVWYILYNISPCIL